MNTRPLTPEHALLVWALRELADVTGNVYRFGPSYPDRTLRFMSAVRLTVGNDADQMAVLLGEDPLFIRMDAVRRQLHPIVNEEVPLDG